MTAVQISTITLPVMMKALKEAFDAGAEQGMNEQAALDWSASNSAMPLRRDRAFDEFLADRGSVATRAALDAMGAVAMDGRTE